MQVVLVKEVLYFVFSVVVIIIGLWKVFLNYGTVEKNKRIINFLVEKNCDGRKIGIFFRRINLGVYGGDMIEVVVLFISLSIKEVTSVSEKNY